MTPHRLKGQRQNQIQTFFFLAFLCTAAYRQKVHTKKYLNQNCRCEIGSTELYICVTRAIILPNLESVGGVCGRGIS